GLECERIPAARLREGGIVALPGAAGLAQRDFRRVSVGAAQHAMATRLIAPRSLSTGSGRARRRPPTHAGGAAGTVAASDTKGCRRPRGAIASRVRKAAAPM